MHGTILMLPPPGAFEHAALGVSLLLNLVLGSGFVWVSHRFVQANEMIDALRRGR